MYIMSECKKRGGFTWVAVMIALTVGTLPARAAILDVCPTGCTYTDLEVALAAAVAEDTIILGGPGAAPPAVETYTLTTTMVIDAAKNGITIRGASDARPDQIEISFAGGPVIEVDTDTDFTIEGVTIKDGTTGVLAKQGSNVQITRCLIDAIGGIGVDCVGVAPDGVDAVTIKSSVITNCTGEATRIDVDGTLNISQCTLLSNGSFGVNAIAGEARIEATLIHDSDDGTNGISGTVTTLFPVANWITDAAGADLALPAGVTDPDAILLDPLVPALVFSPAGFPGQLLDATQERQTGLASNDAKFMVTPSARDFNLTNRATADLIVGADEVTGGGGPAAGWFECYIYQNGELRQYVGEGTIRVVLTAIGVGLDGGSVYIEHDSGNIVDVFTEYMGPFPIVTSAVDTNYGYVDIPILEDDFPIAFPTPANYQVPYLLYIETNDVNGIPDAGVNLHGLPSGGSPELIPFGGSRIFELDTIPPQVLIVPNRLADQYLSPDPFSDGVATAAGPGFWDPLGLLPPDIGANAGLLNYQGIDPQVFFNAISSAPMGFTVSVVFQDIGGSGFETAGLPFTASATTAVEKENVLYFDYRDADGAAWWERNSESDRELISSNANVDVTYTTTPSGEQLTVDWAFANVTHDPLVVGPSARQWHAIANIHVKDLAGNEATLDPTFQTDVPLKPLHLWWFPAAEVGVFPGVVGRIKSGPSEGPDADPRFTWGIERLQGGQDPADPAPVSIGAQWRVYRATTPGFDFTQWEDITLGLWSEWLHPIYDGTITLDSFFNSTQGTLRDIMANTGGLPGDEYLLALIGYDEAGNRQGGPGAGNVTDYTVFESNLIAYNRWTDPGVSVSLGVDTRVRATFWHNNTDVALTTDNDGDGTYDIAQINADERVFGQVSRIPLPEGPCQRVEAGFEITMGLPDVVDGAPFVEYKIFEDGLLVYQDVVPAAGPNNATLTVPYDLVTASPFMNYAPTDSLTGFAFDCNGDGNPDKDRLGDDGDTTAEPGYRRRDVKYVIQFTTHVPIYNSLGVLIDAPDLSPATVEFTVTAHADKPKSADQAIKSFKRE